MIVQSVSPDPGCNALLQGTTFADAYRVQTSESGLDAITAAKRIMARRSRWIDALLVFRNILVAPFGLKDGRQPLPEGIVRLGLFPVVSQEPDRVVLGFDDRHLDFRLVVDAPGNGDVTGTTLIRTHNWLGRTYLAIVLPFHRIIVPAMLRRARLGGG